MASRPPLVFSEQAYVDSLVKLTMSPAPLEEYLKSVGALDNKAADELFKQKFGAGATSQQVMRQEKWGTWPS